MKILLLGKQYQKFFLSYTLPTQGMLHMEFGLSWTTFWPNEKDLFLNFPLREIQKVPYEKLTFFTRQAMATAPFVLL